MHGTPNPYPPPMPGSRPPNARQPSTRGWVIAGLAAAGLVGIGGLAAAVSPDDQPDDKPAATTTSSAPSPAAPQSETWKYVDPAHRKAFVAYLHQLDPGLTPTSPDARPRPLRRAVSVCWDIYDGKPPATVLHNTAYRYNGGQASVPQGSAKARKILVAVKRWVCSSPALRKVYDQRHP